MSAPVKLCSIAYGDEFLGVHRWSENWKNSDTDGKSEALTNSTQLLLTYCTFHDENGAVINYGPETETDASIPDWLRQCCCYEALYLLDLDNDPSRPFPLGILGLIKSGQETFDHDYEPPLFSSLCRQVLENHGAEVDDPLSGGNTWAKKKML